MSDIQSQQVFFLFVGDKGGNWMSLCKVSQCLSPPLFFLFFFFPFLFFLLEYGINILLLHFLPFKTIIVKVVYLWPYPNPRPKWVMNKVGSRNSAQPTRNSAKNGSIRCLIDPFLFSFWGYGRGCWIFFGSILEFRT